MTNSPWKDVDTAFEVMFDEHVVISHKNKKQTIAAVVFTDNTGDALAEDMLDTNREDI